VSIAGYFGINRQNSLIRARRGEPDPSR